MPTFRFPFFYHPNYYNRFVNPRMHNFTDHRILQPNPYGADDMKSNNTHKTPTNNNHKNNNDSAQLNNHFDNSSDQLNRNFIEMNKKNNSKSNMNDENYFFELFGLKLYYDDILLICLIFFLYQEGVKDDELFLSLVLLLLS